MRYRRVLLLADLRADAAAAVSALLRVGPEVAHVVVVACVRDLQHWWSSDPTPEPDARALAAAEAWRAEVASVAPSVELRLAPELRGDTLVDLARASGIDLLVAGSRTLETTPLLLRAARQLAVAVLWPAGDPHARSGDHLFCVAIGRPARASIALFLREHAHPSHHVSVVGPPELPTEAIESALEVLGIRARLQVLPRTGSSWRAALAAAARASAVDLVVLARAHTLLIVGYAWPAPVLLVPEAPPSRPSGGAIDVTDLILVGERLRGHADEVGTAGSLEPLAERVLALVSEGQVIATPITTATGELDLPAELAARHLGAIRVGEDWPPDAIDAVEHPLAVIRPGSRPLALFDCELPNDRLRALAGMDAIEPLAVRLRPTRAAAAIRLRLQALGLRAGVVDARSVLDEGDAHDVAEANDPVRLLRVARRLRAAGFAVAQVAARELEETPERTPAVAIAGNRVEIELDNARARAWLLDAIAGARESVSVQVYMAADDEVGRAVEGALAAAGARGVTVRVLVDSLHALHGTYGTHNALLSRLQTHPGIELRAWRPLAGFPSIRAVKQRDHRKIVVVDGRVALVGGRNLSHEYYTGFEEEPLTATVPWRRVPWLDAGARIEGPAVAAVAHAFRAAWMEAGGASFSIEVPLPVGESAARVVVHQGLADAHTLEAYLELIDGARSHLYAVNGFPYLLELQHALLRALRRGVRVRAMTGHLGPTHDGTPFPGGWAAARNTATDFVQSRLDPIVEAGGDVYLFARRDAPGWVADLGLVHPNVHAKLMSADGRRVAVGSANLDVTSAYWESELMILVEDPAVTAGCERLLDELIAGSIRVDRDDAAWRERARRRAWMRRWPGLLGF